MKPASLDRQRPHNPLFNGNRPKLGTFCINGQSAANTLVPKVLGVALSRVRCALRSDRLRPTVRYGMILAAIGYVPIYWGFEASVAHGAWVTVTALIAILMGFALLSWFTRQTRTTPAAKVSATARR